MALPFLRIGFVGLPLPSFYVAGGKLTFMMGWLGWAWLAICSSYLPLGGLSEAPIDQSEHNYALWEKRIDALMVLLSGEKKILRVDELRRGIESLDIDAYNELSYYERWIASIAKILVEKDIITAAELTDRMADISKRTP